MPKPASRFGLIGRDRCQLSSDRRREGDAGRLAVRNTGITYAQRNPASAIPRSGVEGKRRDRTRRDPADVRPRRVQSYSPAAALEWRGCATVRALSILRDNAMIDAPA
jgi:hypothetical protein